MASKKRRSEDLVRSPAEKDLVRSPGERGEPEPSAARTGNGTGAEGLVSPSSRAPDPEVSEKPRRRRYPAEYKLRVLQEADASTEPGEIGALLRREGLYSSLLSTWRRQREEGTLKALTPTRRGRKAKAPNPLSRRVEELERDKRKLQGQLKQAQAVIEVQKKLSEILALPPTDEPEDGSK